MKSKDIINPEKEIEKFILNKSKNKFINLKCDYFIRKIICLYASKNILENN